ncbi:GDP-mannose 4,6-dehydratase [uncultured Dysosmobacter sp.]|uniref:GDP-mannose 4,6-dehydratase n=1 Tax=uncultured Dysosmobacter sp. TaxID=2591384 RepID=UPI0026277392|nr:GDP-mannose 4,6-dehydratase [uncultured Dysosmobacter sp.]
MVEVLHARGDNVIGTYYRPTTDISELPSEIKMVECDVRYPESVEKVVLEYMPEQIFHLAAQSYPTVSWDRPYETIETNVNGTVAVYEAVKKARQIVDRQYDPMVVVACSSAEYGESLNLLGGNDVFVKETTELLPLHPYGVSKVGQDLISFQYYKNDHIRCIRARIFNSTGTRKVNDVTSDFTRRAVEAERSGIYELRVGNLETRRAIMDQRDLVSALLLLAERGIPGEVYNISSERIYQMKDIVRMIEKQLGHRLEVRVDPALLRPTDERVIAGDVTKLQRDTGWKQQIPMEQTVADMLEWWRKRIR